jgi:probable rRNA maturation factor
MSASKKAPEFHLAVQYAVKPDGAPTRTDFRRWAKAAQEKALSATIRLVGEAEGRRLNRDFRGKDAPTNVLTFVYDDLPAEAGLAGDIVLCAEVVAREAAQQGKPLLAHYAHLTVHGLLHLQGYDHEDDAAARVMENRESEIVMKLGYPDPYAER